MTHSKPQHTAGEALRLALEIMTHLVDDCARIVIAGSLRRGKSLVGDVELVAEPLFRPSPAGEQNRLDLRLQQMLDLGMVSQRRKTNGDLIAWGERWTVRQMAGQDRPPTGSRYKAMLYKGLPVDIFIVLPDRQWGPTLVLRTGPGEANEALVTRRGQMTRNGVRGICPTGIHWADGALFQDGVQLDTPDERSVFKAVGLPLIAPHERSAEMYQRMVKSDRAGWDLRSDRCEIVWRVQGGRSTLPPLPEVLDVPTHQPSLF